MVNMPIGMVSYDKEVTLMLVLTFPNMASIVTSSVSILAIMDIEISQCCLMEKKVLSVSVPRLAKFALGDTSPDELPRYQEFPFTGIETFDFWSIDRGSWRFSI
jgi:hypothetical protein